ncbi:hypothetical protein FE257_003469 [Aspergillus nanangensis]|uniref:Sister chromatid cohesion protein Dcc1 n=1 Tax=Aspergillus nanangensis TaxID=2582783 RepID=A0AAD4CCQ5_ASPNN|nr:hypothetical protein FE257_003469 [Aspergillus nanangensis]
MSTQAARSILFTHTSPQQGYKLLELPPELADVLSSSDPPIIELKSPIPSSLDAGSEAQDPTLRDTVNLCTATQTYQIRQVQSSNSIHIIRPSNGADDRVQLGDINIVVAGEEDAHLDLVDSITTIAKCGSTLELYEPPEGFSAVPYLLRLLRVFDLVDWEEGDQVLAKLGRGQGSSATAAATTVIVGGGTTYDMEQGVVRAVMRDVPVCGALCERGWVDMCAFVVGGRAGDEGGDWCRRPTAGVRLAVWKRVVEGAVLQGIDLEKQFLVSDLWRSLLDDGDDGVEPFPRPLFEAVVRRVCEAGDRAGLGRLFREYEMKWTSIDKDSCVRWVGEMYLEAMAPSADAALRRSDYLSAWKDHLPEAWREEVAFTKLQDGSYKYPDPTTICFVNEADRQKLKKNVSTDASAATAAKKTRNWHELFKNQKRQKR